MQIWKRALAKIIKPNILVIGGTGFIGYHLLLEAKRKGWKTTSVSLNKPKKYRFVKGVKYIKVDIYNQNDLKRKIKKNFDYVVNLGGYGSHIPFEKGGDKLFKSHFMGLVNLINVISKAKLKKFIQVGSSEEYGDAKAPQNENSKGSVNSPYAMAKLSCSNFLKILHKTEKYPSTVLRFFLVYGNKQDSNRILPQIIKGCLNNKKFAVTKGDQMRDFCHIKDIIDAIFLTLKSKKANGEILNIGYGKPKKIKFIINYIQKIIGKGKPIFGKLKYRDNENLKLYPNIKKAKSLLGWSPKISLKVGLNSVIKSYR